MEAKSVLEAQCRWCGTVTLRPADLRCAVGPRSGTAGLCEFACPICDRLALLASTPAGIEALSNKGARLITGRAPFEILEPHKGFALSWDELLDLHLALGRTSVPQTELVR
jgi:hypothetical protein